MVVGNERAHAAGLDDPEGLAVVAFSLFGAVRPGDVTGEAEGVGVAAPSPQPAGETSNSVP